MSVQDASNTHQTDRQRLPRSRNGCLTCRRRKVRCNEQRPRCSHCERLNLQCLWRQAPQNPSAQQGQTPISGRVPQFYDPGLAWGPTSHNLDFNDILWQGTLSLDSTTALDWPTVDLSRNERSESWSVEPNVPSAGSNMARVPETGFQNAADGQAIVPGDGFMQMSPASQTSTSQAVDAERNALVEHFLASEVPPILVNVEVGPKWTSAKVLLMSLAASSDTVQDAIAAFTALQLSGTAVEKSSTYRMYFDRCKAFVARDMELDADQDFTKLPCSLVTIFFLSYSALLSDRIGDAHALLEVAAQAVRQVPHERINSTARRLISWIRLVDSRAASAGGSGSFLNETDNQTSSPYERLQDIASECAPTADDVEEILFDTLYTPGLIFYQRVQSLMARVSAIDRWHRGRGTVKDETEVMAIAARISTDLLKLEIERPALMDIAVAGHLTEQHLLAGLCSAIVRSYRTYWANYHAGHIHLHRVAYPHLEAAAEVQRAKSTIKQMARHLERSDGSLPVNFIWPLLMACCEEENQDERAWMIGLIRGMQSSATNAQPIADVLEEVHRRQDATHRRADVRQTSLDLFNKSFAVL